jgi:hypothetical protein
MSFEGRYQKLCKKGHYEEQDIHMETDRCEICDSKWDKVNLVDDTNEPNQGFDYSMLDSKYAVKILTERLEDMRSTIDYATHCNIQLTQENEKLKEALRFYADKSNPNSIFNPDYQDEIDCEFCEDTQFTHFGKLARQVLREIAIDNVCDDEGWL